jgi:hypothetical protein
MEHDPEADTLDLTEALAELHEFTEPCTCPFHQRLHAPHAARLARGSTILARRAAGDGRTALTRLGLTAFAAPYAVLAIDQQRPYIVPAAAAAWCVAAWRAGRPPPRNLPYELGLGIWALIGDQPAVHLSTLYAELQARPAAAHLTDERIRAVLDHVSIPVRRQVRAHGAGGRSGIHRDDLAPLLGLSAPSSGRRAPVTSDVDDELAPVEGA